MQLSSCRQTVLLDVLAGQGISEKMAAAHQGLINKAPPSWDRTPGKRYSCGYSFSRFKHRCLAALKRTADLPAQCSSSDKGQTVSSGFLTHMYPDWEIPPSRGWQTPHTGELWLASGRCSSEMKLPEEETGSNLCCSAASASDTQANRVGNGPAAEGHDC